MGPEGGVIGTVWGEWPGVERSGGAWGFVAWPEVGGGWSECVGLLVEGSGNVTRDEVDGGG